jgi:hypothetical protein
MATFSPQENVVKTRQKGVIAMGIDLLPPLLSLFTLEKGWRCRSEIA